MKSVYAFWEANLNSFAALLRAEERGDDDPMQVIGSALKERIRTLARSERNGERQGNVEANASLGLVRRFSVRNQNGRNGERQR